MLSGQAAKKGKSSVIAMAIDRIAYERQRHYLRLKLEVIERGTRIQYSFVYGGSNQDLVESRAVPRVCGS